MQSSIRGERERSATVATYTIDTYHVRLPSSRPTTDLDPPIAVAGFYLSQFPAILQLLREEHSSGP
jgi:hypothetical protein